MATTFANALDGLGLLGSDLSIVILCCYATWYTTISILSMADKGLK